MTWGERPCRHERFQFTGEGGHQLAAALDTPDGPVQAYALFAHCFTCGKDIRAAKRIAERLTALGIGVLRFDFTGLGSSEGEFANTTFSSNVEDLVAAATHMRERGHAPSLLIGHSLGGAAILAAASQIPEARGVITIAAPSDPGHVLHLFKDHVLAVSASMAKWRCRLRAGRSGFRSEFLDDVAKPRAEGEKISALRKALLIFHSPTDETVGIENATAIFVAAKHPKSFVSLSGADHLLSRRSDAEYVANVIGAWADAICRACRSAAGCRGGRGAAQRRGRAKRGNGKYPADRSTAGPHQHAGGRARRRRRPGQRARALRFRCWRASAPGTLDDDADVCATAKSLPLDRITVTLKHSVTKAAD